jgi:hypothetical protein
LFLSHIENEGKETVLDRVSKGDQKKGAAAWKATTPT